jgi:hypothetical protein
MTLILSEAKRRLVEMEIGYRGSLRARVQFGIVKNVGAVVRRVTAFRLDAFKNSLPFEMFTYGVPYEASRTYRIMKSEFECKRCAALVEAHRQGLRGF